MRRKKSCSSEAPGGVGVLVEAHALVEGREPLGVRDQDIIFHVNANHHELLPLPEDAEAGVGDRLGNANAEDPGL